MGELDRHDRDTALVVFSGQTDLSYLKFLKPGFRHCFVILKLGDRWVSIDQLAHMTRIDLHRLSDNTDMNGLLSEHGLTVVSTHLRDVPLVPSPPLLCTCVEIVKRIIGIRSARVWTPWQLYCHLLKTAD